jgi:hypothetical protein
MNPYCVILCLQPLVNSTYHPHTKRFYLRTATADGADKNCIKRQSSLACRRH